MRRRRSRRRGRRRPSGPGTTRLRHAAPPATSIRPLAQAAAAGGRGAADRGTAAPRARDRWRPRCGRYAPEGPRLRGQPSAGILSAPTRGAGVRPAGRRWPPSAGEQAACGSRGSAPRSSSRITSGTSPASAASDRGQHWRDRGQRLARRQWLMPVKRCSWRNLSTAPFSTLRIMSSSLELQEVPDEGLSEVVDVSRVHDWSRDELDNVADRGAVTERLLLDCAVRGGVGLDRADFEGVACSGDNTGPDSDRAWSGSGAQSWAPSPTSSS
ncbi:unnamed protein product [Prorocentrum cordatum]|uniref:Pentapeptide repeat-containing protein n=1 Tax=Prorocentrum cordatum TaxID=2364126 RepID=A0ABN9S7Y6_9DINO|nr:unnamed protein product [Polarella glacialis]